MPMISFGSISLIVVPTSLSCSAWRQSCCTSRRVCARKVAEDGDRLSSASFTLGIAAASMQGHSAELRLFGEFRQPARQITDRTS